MKQTLGTGWPGRVRVVAVTGRTKKGPPPLIRRSSEGGPSGVVSVLRYWQLSHCRSSIGSTGAE
jgi:hypothetical protein